MAERYKTIYKEETPFFNQDCPIELISYAVLYDQKEKKLLGQLKLRNCSERQILGADVSISTFDQFGEPVEVVSNYQYINVNAEPGSDFGTKTAVPFVNNTAIKTLAVTINSVIFSDDTRWKAMVETSLVEAPKQKLLIDNISGELIETYQLVTKGVGKYIPIECNNGNWFCSCGTFNFETHRCGGCKANKTDIFRYIDEKELSTIHADKLYDEGINLLKGSQTTDIEKAKQIFEGLDGWKDSASYVTKCQEKIRSILEEEKAQQEKNRREEKQKKKKKIIAGIVAIVAVIVAIIGILTVNKMSEQRTINAIKQLSKCTTYAQIVEVIGEEADRISNGSYGWNHSPKIGEITITFMIIPGSSEPPVRTLRATIPENESH